MYFENFLLVVDWACIPFFWWFLLRLAGLRLFVFSIPTIVFVAIIVFQYIGLPILYFKLDEYRALFVTDSDLVLTVGVATTFVTTQMLIGFIFGRTLFGPLKVSNFESNLNKKKIGVGAALLLLLSILVLILYIQNVGISKLVLFAVINSSSDNISLLRSDLGNSFVGKYYRYQLFFRETMIFSTLILYAQYLIDKRRGSFLLFLIGLCGVILSSVMSGEKAPVVYAFVSLFFVKCLIKEEGRLEIKRLVPMLITSTILLIFGYQYFMNTEGYFQALSNLSSRAFAGALQPSYHYLDMFPKHHEFLAGRSFPNPMGIFPFENYRLTVEVMNWANVNPELLDSGVVGSMPAMFWGELYANFGFEGLIGFPVVVGIMLYWLNATVVRFGTNSVTAALLSWLAMHYKTLAETSISSFLVDLPLITILFFTILILFYASNGRIRLRSH